MCLAIIGKILDKQDHTATVDVMGVRREADLTVLPDAGVGDYVLLHAGFALSIVSEEDARETFDLFRSLEPQQ